MIKACVHRKSSEEHLFFSHSDFLQQNLSQSKYAKNVLVSNTDSVTLKGAKKFLNESNVSKNKKLEQVKVFW